jgi:hypothetical protein
MCTKYWLEILKGGHHIEEVDVVIILQRILMEWGCKHVNYQWAETRVQRQVLGKTTMKPLV